MLIQVSLDGLHDLTLAERGRQAPAMDQDVVIAPFLDTTMIANNYLIHIKDEAETMGHR